jgi:hypothetical protein
MSIKSLIEFFKEYGERLLVLTLPIAMIISVLILVYCNEPAREYNTDEDNINITIHTVDKHEYIVYSIPYYQSGGICHKVDCKFCTTKNGKD